MSQAGKAGLREVVLPSLSKEVLNSCPASVFLQTSLPLMSGLPGVTSLTTWVSTALPWKQCQVEGARLPLESCLVPVLAPQDTPAVCKLLIPPRPQSPLAVSANPLSILIIFPTLRYIFSHPFCYFTPFVHFAPYSSASRTLDADPVVPFTHVFSSAPDSVPLLTLPPHGAERPVFSGRCPVSPWSFVL